jgi:hypothetical protein
MSRLVLFLAGSAFLCACSSVPVPNDQLTAAQAAVAKAEGGGAQDNPQASLRLKNANDQISEAKSLIDQEENEKAKRALERAEADAEVALGLARAEQLKAQAAAAQQEVKDLQSKYKNGAK